MPEPRPSNDAALLRTAVPSPVRTINSTQRTRLLALVLLIVTIVAYQPVWHAGFIWDDDALVTNNSVLRSPGGLKSIWFKPGSTLQYYPLVFTSFWAEYHLWNLQPLGYHLVNVLLHACNAMLLWQVLRRLEVPGAWLAGAIFAVHPVEVESVAWVSERKNTLSGMFYLLALLALFRYRPLKAVATENRQSDWRFYLLGLVLFLSALLSKTVACSLPAVMVLLTWWKKGHVEKRDVGVLMPLFVIGAALGLMTAWLEKYHVGAGTDWSLSFVQRCLLAGRALWFYAGKLFWPHQLSFIYPRWEIDACVWWQYLFPLSAAAALITLWLLRRRVGKTPLIAVLVFAVMLFPALGFFDVFPFRYSLVADHFQYLASAGLIAAVASGGAMVCDRAGRLGKQIGVVAATVVLLSLGALTWRQAHIYHDDETVWQDTLAKNPRCWMAHDNLGTDLMLSGRLQEAMGHYKQALRINPDSAMAHNDLGAALMREGRLQEAISHYEQALRLRPDYPEVHENLGNALLRAGKVQEAISHYEQALRLEPDNAEAYYNLGAALLQTGKVQDAVGRFNRALRIKPDYAEAYIALGNALEQAADFRGAIKQYEELLRIKPNIIPAQNDLAWLLATLAPEDGGNPVQSLGLARQVSELTRNQVAPYLDTLAAAYAATGQFSNAIATAQHAIDLARSAGQPQIVEQIEPRLELYRSGRAYRQSVAMTSPHTP